MEYWQMEQKAEEQRAQIRREVAARRLQQEALRAAPPQPGWFAGNMIALGTWMVAAGEHLRKRYEYIPTSRRTMRRNTAG